MVYYKSDKHLKETGYADNNVQHLAAALKLKMKNFTVRINFKKPNEYIVITVILDMIRSDMSKGTTLKLTI